MKRLITLVLAIAIVLSLVPVYALEAQGESDETKFLKTIGVLEKSFSENAKITKGEFTKRIVNLIYPDVDFSGLASNGAFYDVSAATPNGSYIKAAKDMGIINGDTANMFHPESMISSVNAVVISCNALGYSIYANEFGGYPSGYMTVAANHDLTKGLSYMDEIDGLYMAKLLYNILFLFPTKIEGISVDGITISENRISVLETVYNIKKYNAVLYDNGITSMDGSSAEDTDRCVFLNSKNDTMISAYIENSDIQEHLGALMDVYIMYDELSGKSKVVNYKLDSDCDEYMLSSDAIIKFDYSGIEYETDKNTGKTNKISFKSGLPAVIYNGILFPGYDINTLVPQDGFVRVVVNNNEVYVIEIISFNIYNNNTSGLQRNIVVDTFSEEDGYINCRLNPVNSLKIEDNDIISFVNSNVKSFSSLKPGMIISVAQSREKIDGGYVYYLCVSDKEIKGVVSGASQSEGFLTVGSEDFKVSKNLLSAKPNFINNIKYGDESTFYLDVTDKIAYAASDAVKTKNYAYLLAARVVTKGESELVVKILDKDGGIMEYTCSPKVKINSASCTDAEDALKKLTSRPAGSSYTESIKKPIIVTLDNNGYIRAIDTDSPNVAGSTDINIYSTQSHISYTNEEVTDYESLKAGYRNPRVNVVNKGSSYSVDGRFYMNSDTVIFSVPEIDMYGLDAWIDYASNQYAYYKKAPVKEIVKEYEGSIEDKYYRLYDLASLDDRKCYDIQGYDIDPDTGYAGLVILRGRNDVYWYSMVPYSASYPMAVFLKTSEYYDEEFDRMVTKIYYTVDGENESCAIIDTDNTLNIFKYFIKGSKAADNGFKVDIPALKKGDIIRILSQDGRVSHIERVLKSDNLFHAFSSVGYPYIEPTPYNTTFLPFDERNAYNSISGNYVVGAGYVRSQSSGNIKLMLGKNTVDTVQPSKPLTYTEQVYNTVGIKPIVINVSVAANDLNKVNEITKVYQGDFTDIITTEEVGGDISKASLVIVKSTDYNTETVFIINREVK